jgi:hypothetical protein
MAHKKHESEVIVTQIIHDLRSKKSYVTVVWKGQEEKKLGLPVPFGTTVDDVEAETYKAVQTFQEELANVSVKVP